MSAPLPLVPHAHGQEPPSDWVRRWSHLVPYGGTVLDLACGHGRHMKWFASHGHPVTGVDRSVEAIVAAGSWGEAIVADIENGPWPLMQADQVRQFDAVVVTNYLWRALFPRIIQSLAPGGVLIYETFAASHETVGKPTRPDFLLQPGELLRASVDLQVVAYQNGFIARPERFVQRIAAVRPEPSGAPGSPPARYELK